MLIKANDNILIAIRILLSWDKTSASIDGKLSFVLFQIKPFGNKQLMRQMSYCFIAAIFAYLDLIKWFLSSLLVAAVSF